MIYGSVCSGIEAASVAWHPLGWCAAFLSEIEAFPRAVLAHHYPDVPLHGDFTTIEAGQYAAIDVLVGGTPCQSFSIAGLRKGLDDERGNLALEFCRLARRLGPRWVVWENVPGVLSLDGGRAFGSILGGLADCGYGLAYRVLDAQFVRVDGYERAVPQRRRRVFVVGYLGDWRRAAAVLFERQSLRGDPAPRRSAGKGSAPTLSARTKSGGGLGTDFDLDGGLVAHTLNAKGGAGRSDSESKTFLAEPVAHALRADDFDASEDGTGRGTPLTVEIAGPMTACGGTENKHGHGWGQQEFTNGYIVPEAVAFAENTRNELRLVDGDGGIAPSLQTQGGKAGRGYPAVAQAPLAFNARQDPDVFDGHTGPLDTDGGTQGIAHAPHARGCAEGVGIRSAPETWRVRRLTPTECERLQGFPDGYTLIPGAAKGGWRDVDETEDVEELRALGMPVRLTGNVWRVKDADGPRYKALGNSMAVNVMRWIGRRIEMVEGITRPVAGGQPKGQQT